MEDTRLPHDALTVYWAVKSLPKASREFLLHLVNQNGVSWHPHTNPGKGKWGGHEELVSVEDKICMLSSE